MSIQGETEARRRGFSLDNLVGAGKQRHRHVETNRPRLITRFEIWISI
jgi:hypothetical protein